MIEEGRQLGLKEGERKGRKEGRKEGEKRGEKRAALQGLLALYGQRFGVVPETVKTRLELEEASTLMGWFGVFGAGQAEENARVLGLPADANSQ